MLRSERWFNDAEDVITSTLYVERYMNSGVSREELQSGRPIIGIAQTGSDLAPCNRHHRDLAERTRDGIRDAGGVPMEFPTHPIQETGKRPTAALDRNLAYLSLVEVLFGYPLDGVVLTTGCDKTTPAAIMAAATVDIPAIVLSGGPMLNGWLNGVRVGSGSTVWEARERLASGEITSAEAVELIAAASPSVGHCNTMGTALTMNVLAEALGMSLPGCAAIPAPHRERGEMAYRTGMRAVEMVHEDLRPSMILTREAFENAIVVASAIGASSNAPVHINAIAKHAGFDIHLHDWDRVGKHIPLLVNLQPVGEYLGEDFFRAGGAAAVMAELLPGEHIHTEALTVSGQDVETNLAGLASQAPEVIHPLTDPLLAEAGFAMLHGNLFDSASMKVSAISPEFRERYLSDPDRPNTFDANVVVFDGPEDYHQRIESPELNIDESTILVMRGAGAIGFPGSGEVVNMQPPGALIARGIRELPCMGDGRQSGTSGSPAILNASPEAAMGGGLAILRTGDVVRVDLTEQTVSALLSDDVIAERRRALEESGGYPIPEAQTPWQVLHRAHATQLDQGMVLGFAPDFQRIVQTWPAPRHSH